MELRLSDTQTWSCVAHKLLRVVPRKVYFALLCAGFLSSPVLCFCCIVGPQLFGTFRLRLTGYRKKMSQRLVSRINARSLSTRVKAAAGEYVLPVSRTFPELVKPARLEEFEEQAHQNPTRDRDWSAGTSPSCLFDPLCSMSCFRRDTCARGKCVL